MAVNTYIKEVRTRVRTEQEAIDAKLDHASGLSVEWQASRPSRHRRPWRASLPPESSQTHSVCWFPPGGRIGKAPSLYWWTRRHYPASLSESFRSLTIPSLASRWSPVDDSRLNESTSAPSPKIPLSSVTGSQAVSFVSLLASSTTSASAEIVKLVASERFSSSKTTSNRQSLPGGR